MIIDYKTIKAKRKEKSDEISKLCHQGRKQQRKDVP